MKSIKFDDVVEYVTWVQLCAKVLASNLGRLGIMSQYCPTGYQVRIDYGTDIVVCSASVSYTLHGVFDGE